MSSAKNVGQPAEPYWRESRFSQKFADADKILRKPPFDKLIVLSLKNPNDSLDAAALGFRNEHVRDLIALARCPLANDDLLGEIHDIPIVLLSDLEITDDEDIKEIITFFNRDSGHDDGDYDQELRLLISIGPRAVPFIRDYVCDPTRKNRGYHVEALREIGKKWPEARPAVIDVLTTLLKGFARQDPEVNATIVYSLGEMKDTKSLPLVRQAYAAGRIDESHHGGWAEHLLSLDQPLSLSDRMIPKCQHCELPYAQCRQKRQASIKAIFSACSEKASAYANSCRWPQALAAAQTALACSVLGEACSVWVFAVLALCNTSRDAALSSLASSCEELRLVRPMSTRVVVAALGFRCLVRTKDIQKACRVLSRWELDYDGWPRDEAANGALTIRQLVGAMREALAIGHTAAAMLCEAKRQAPPPLPFHGVRLTVEPGAAVKRRMKVTRCCERTDSTPNKYVFGHGFVAVIRDCSTVGVRKLGSGVGMTELELPCEEPPDLIAAHGRVVAVAESSLKIVVWDVASAEPRRLAVLTGHNDRIDRLLLDDDRLVSSSEDRTIRVWKISEAKQVQQVWPFCRSPQMLAVIGNRLFVPLSNTSRCICEYDLSTDGVFLRAYKAATPGWPKTGSDLGRWSFIRRLAVNDTWLAVANGGSGYFSVTVWYLVDGGSKRHVWKRQGKMFDLQLVDDLLFVVMPAETFEVYNLTTGESVVRYVGRAGVGTEAFAVEVEDSKKTVTAHFASPTEVMSLPLTRRTLDKCQTCGKVETEPGVYKLCSRCRAPGVRYCGVECQRADWRQHKLTCKPPEETTL